MATSRFAVSKTPVPSHLKCLNLCRNDPFPGKFNGIIGLYADEDGRPFVMEAVKRAEIEMAQEVQEDKAHHEYLGQLGLPQFNRLALELVLGETSDSVREERSFACQAQGCLGALRIGMEFLAKVLGRKMIYLPQQTWFLHANIARYSGFEDLVYYRYVNTSTNCDLDFQGLLEDLKNAPSKSVVVLQAIAHNPTGIDPTLEQWQDILEIVRERDLFPLFDMAYPGLVSGCVAEDAFAVRLFEKVGVEMIVATSFSQNFGLYSERTGALVVVSKRAENVLAIEQAIKHLVIWPGASTPPSHGANIVVRIMTNPDLRQIWRQDLLSIAHRIKVVRRELQNRLEALNSSPGSWQHLTEQQGIFSYLGLNLAQCRRLMADKHVYICETGRINMAAVNFHNVEFLAQAIHDITHDNQGTRA